MIETWLAWPLLQMLRLFKPILRYWIMGEILPMFTKAPNQKMAPSIEKYDKAAAGTLHKELNQLDINSQGVNLQIDPGRCMYGNTGIHLTRVKKFKQQTN